LTLAAGFLAAGTGAFAIALTGAFACALGADFAGTEEDDFRAGAAGFSALTLVALAVIVVFQLNGIYSLYSYFWRVKRCPHDLLKLRATGNAKFQSQICHFCTINF
jgi:hypothetical protein